MIAPLSDVRWRIRNGNSIFFQLNDWLNLGRPSCQITLEIIDENQLQVQTSDIVVNNSNWE